MQNHRRKNSLIKTCHLTSVHPRSDNRIFHKECHSLAKGGYSVSLVVADGKGEEITKGVSIFDVGLPKNRLDRRIRVTRKIFAKALELDAHIYHFHDPELIPIGLKLKRRGKKVVFDDHEYVPEQLLKHKGFCNQFIYPKIFSLYLPYACKKFDGIVAATPYIRDKHLTSNPNTLDISNFPILKEIQACTSWQNKKRELCYILSPLNPARCIGEVLVALENLKAVTLHLTGMFFNNTFKKQITSMPGWNSVVYHGIVGRPQIAKILEDSMVGLELSDLNSATLYSQPTKVFEYMAAGIPVVCSQIPYWQTFVDDNDCGISVNPRDPSAIAKAISVFISDPLMAEQMGKNGRNAVAKKYSWEAEEQKLLFFYEKCLHD